MRNAAFVLFAVFIDAATFVVPFAAAEEGRTRLPHLQDYPWVSGTPKEIPDRVPGQSVSEEGIRIRVGRIWKNEERTLASLNVRNISPFEFYDVTIVCTALDESNRAITTQQTELTPQIYGALRPGFTTVLELAFATGRSQVRSLSCDAHARGLPHRVD